MIDKPIDKEKVLKIIESIKPRCPYCGADTTYAYYGYDGDRYCPNCMKNLKKVKE